MLIQSVPQSSLSVIDHYWRLKAAENKFVRCPYYRNPRSGRERWGLAVYAGKGSPHDIEEELKIVEKLEGVNFTEMSGEQIRDIMKKRKLGIECSGFIAHILDAYAHERYKKPLYRMIKFNRRGLGWLFCKMRPYTHIDVETLVAVNNARPIYSASEIIPGDLIRFNTEIEHAIIVTRTERDDTGNVARFFYAHSVLEDNREGVKRGRVDFINPAADLLSQSWQEEPNTGKSINQRGEPKVYRLRILEDSPGPTNND